MRVASVPIGVQRPTSLCFGNDVFSLDMNEKNGQGLQRNMVSVLVLGWLYIFSAEMVERIQEDSTLVYTDSRAELTSSDEVHDVIDVGDVNEDAARWWAAILSPSRGWRATILQKGKDQFISPWYPQPAFCCFSSGHHSTNTQLLWRACNIALHDRTKLHKTTSGLRSGCS